jgi:hypothetical protein
VAEASASSLFWQVEDFGGGGFVEVGHHEVEEMKEAQDSNELALP